MILLLSALAISSVAAYFSIVGLTLIFSAAPQAIMVMGIAGSLDEPLREATTGMSLWLTHTYDLDSSEIAMVLGASLKYDIAEIVNPHINVVARLSKDVLSGIPAIKHGR